VGARGDVVGLLQYVYRVLNSDEPLVMIIVLHAVPYRPLEMV
jgi:hypothetical protein